MLGNRVVALKKGNRVQMILGKGAAEKAISALIWLGSGHESEMPMAITWKLDCPLPGDLYTSFAAAVA